MRTDAEHTEEMQLKPGMLPIHRSPGPLHEYCGYYTVEPIVEHSLDNAPTGNFRLVVYALDGNTHVQAGEVLLEQNKRIIISVNRREVARLQDETAPEEQPAPPGWKPLYSGEAALAYLQKKNKELVHEEQSISFDTKVAFSEKDLQGNHEHNPFYRVARAIAENLNAPDDKAKLAKKGEKTMGDILAGFASDSHIFANKLPATATESIEFQASADAVVGVTAA